MCRHLIVAYRKKWPQSSNHSMDATEKPSRINFVLWNTRDPNFINTSLYAVSFIACPPSPPLRSLTSLLTSVFTSVLALRAQLRMKHKVRSVFHKVIKHSAFFYIFFVYFFVQIPIYNRFLIFHKMIRRRCRPWSRRQHAATMKYSSFRKIINVLNSKLFMYKAV